MLIERCNICGGKIKKKLELPFESIVGMAESYTQIVGICLNCGFIFTQNPFSAEQLENRYKNHSKFEYDNDSVSIQENELVRESFRKSSIIRKDFIDHSVGLENIKSLLEIGAASGYNLSIYDCNVYGIEPSRKNCISARENYGIDMYCGMFEEFRKEKRKEKYDLIYLAHVLEHIVNPCDFIKQCAEINNKYMFIEVPTFDYKFDNEPYGMFAEEHVNLFTFEGLQSLMTVCGYCLVDAEIDLAIGSMLPAGSPAIRTIWTKYDGIAPKLISVQSSEMLLDTYLFSSKNGMERIKKIIGRIEDNEKLAIWGTGHHASMLLQNTVLGKKNIVRVYDSDKRKEGKLFHNIPIQPFSAQDIYNGEVGVVLLATYTAQKAIEKVIKPFQSQVEVIKLYELDE